MQISADARHAVGDRLAQYAEVVEQEARTLVVVGVSDAVLGDPHRPVVPAGDSEHVAESCGIDLAAEVTARCGARGPQRVEHRAVTDGWQEVGDGDVNCERSAETCHASAEVVV